MSLPHEITSWFLQHRRDLPWRSLPKDPYHVWISEVMLQQTRVEVVIPYFNRFVQLFPTLASLAKADDALLLKAWEGLGYYSRVRALKKTAMILTSWGQSSLPDDLDALLQLPGIGPYTAGAILSFAFQKRGIAIDGNVKRVVSRLFALDTPIDSKQLWNQVKMHLEEDLLQGDAPALVMEGLIELGALVCGPAPKCARCPLAAHCIAFQQGREQELPLPKKWAEITTLRTPIAIVIYKPNGDRLFLVRPPKDHGLFKGLAVFPTQKEVFHEGMRISQEYGLHKDLPEIVQSYTRYKETLLPTIYEAYSTEIQEGLIWLSEEQIVNLSMPAGHRKMREMALKL